MHHYIGLNVDHTESFVIEKKTKQSLLGNSRKIKLDF